MKKPIKIKTYKIEVSSSDLYVKQIDIKAENGREALQKAEEWRQENNLQDLKDCYDGTDNEVTILSVDGVDVPGYEALFNGVEVPKAKTQVVVVVRGGLVTGVYTKDKNTEVIMLDHDNFNAGDEPDAEQARTMNELETPEKNGWNEIY